MAPSQPSGVSAAPPRSVLADDHPAHDGIFPLRTFPLRTLVGGLAAIGLVFLALALTYWYLDQQAAARARTSVTAARNVEQMRYYDEALTMSARLNPFSADRSYERRYLRLGPQLDGVIRDTMRLVDDRHAAADIALTGDANKRLVAMEMHSFALVRTGEPRRAYALLTSPAYNTQKRRYAHGFEHALSRFTYVTAKTSGEATFYVSVMLGVSFALLLFGILPISLYLVHAARRWSAERKSAYEDALAHEILAVQNEQLRELDRLKDDFVASVSHELRTPLTSIRGYVEMMLDDMQLRDEHRHFLSIVDRNSERLMKLVCDLLFMAQVDAGRFELEYASVDLARLAAERVEALLPIAEAKGISVRVDGEGVIADGDPLRLAQMMDNLLSNALKFTEDGGQVVVRVLRTPETSVIEFSDTGIGMSAGDQQRLFERFFRAEGALSRSIAGTGLGLSIVAAIVDAHGGKLNVQSTEKEGTTFRVELPLRARAAAALQEEVAA